MTKPSDVLLRARGVIETVTAKTATGTADNPRMTTRVDLAKSRAEDRAGGGHLPGPTRGGTSDPKEADERKERDRTCRQAELDHYEIDHLTRTIATAADKLARIVNRQAEIVHESKLPADVLPGCVSCARKETEYVNGADQTITGGYQDIDHRYMGQRLCRPCGEFKAATDGLPPVRWCYIRDRENGKAANRWLADNFPKLLESVQRKSTHGRPTPELEECQPCANVWTDMERGIEHRCIRSQGHEPGCRGVYQGKSIAFPVVAV